MARLTQRNVCRTTQDSRGSCSHAIRIRATSCCGSDRTVQHDRCRHIWCLYRHLSVATVGL